ncbi:adenylate kinase [Jeongeupia sp. HS-3]|uniref:AAA family ATPase n=1 Tax=Jeongeupia sp. HS-3 TaxID=1009682 RepID=UPI0018A34CD8|nr:AAA family ATPase [Jeongeupia sp. HS-3]BCL76562.1 adenylate kinase [Jeongeupia sp. HS-3]
MRVLVTGAAGSGTSTLGEALAQRWGVRFLEADAYFWLPTQPPFSAKREPAERKALLVQALEGHGSSVVAGSVIAWGPEIEDTFDLVVFLYVSTEVRLQRLKQREETLFGQANPAFLEWASQYDAGPPEGRSLAKHNAWLAARQCPVVRLVGDHPVTELLSRLVGPLSHTSFGMG